MLCLFCDSQVRPNLDSYEHHLKDEHMIQKSREVILTLCFMDEFEREDVLEEYKSKLERFQKKSKSRKRRHSAEPEEDEVVKANTPKIRKCNVKTRIVLKMNNIIKGSI